MEIQNQTSLPVPPMRYRFLVGPLNESAFENSEGLPIFGTYIPMENYKEVFDFGCGCGRTGRMLMQQKQKPEKYMGIDINKRMIEWCQQTYSPIQPSFKFAHHDVHNLLLGSTNTNRSTAPFPVEDSSFTLFIAISVFTHLLPKQTEYYLSEMSRILRPGGMAQTTWFLFNKEQFPMMQSFQNALFINTDDPTNAVIYDEQYLRGIAADNGLEILHIHPGYQTQITFRKIGQELSNLNQLKYREVPRPAVQVKLDSNGDPEEIKNGHKDTINLDPAKAFATTAAEVQAILTQDDVHLIDSPAAPKELLPCVFNIQNTGAMSWQTFAVTEGAPFVRILIKWQALTNQNSSFYYNVIPANIVAPGENVVVPIIIGYPDAPGSYRLIVSLAFGDTEMTHITPLSEVVRVGEVEQAPQAQEMAAEMAHQSEQLPAKKSLADKLFFWRNQ